MNGLDYLFPLLSLPAPLGQNPVRTGRSAVLLVATAPAAAQWVVNNKRVNICVCAGAKCKLSLICGREECFSVQSCVAVEKEGAFLATEPEDDSQYSVNFIPKGLSIHHRASTLALTLCPNPELISIVVLPQ